MKALHMNASIESCRSRWLPLAGLLTALCAPMAGTAQVVFEEFHGLNLTIPDGDPFGISHTVNLSYPGGPYTIQDLSVDLDISGGSNGDLYVQLTHGSGHVVLLNRVGRRSDDPLGYDDPGLDVTFADGAGSGDIHRYRFEPSGSHTTPLNAPLTGTWQPDGRASDPASSLDTDPRTRFLSSFIGGDPNGAWTLYLVDAEPGDEAVLEGWALNFVLVPEPEASVAVVLLGLLGLAAWRRCRRET